MNTRLLGTLCVIGSLIGLADSVRSVMNGEPLAQGLRFPDTITSISNVLGAIGALCGLLGFIALRGTGTKPIFRLLTYLPGVSYVASIILGLAVLTGLLPLDANNPVIIILASLGDLLSPAAWLVIAILTIAAKSWHGWRRFVPLAIVLAFPLGIVVSVSMGLVGVFGIINYAAAALLGYAVQTYAPVPQLREAVA